VDQETWKIFGNTIERIDRNKCTNCRNPELLDNDDDDDDDYYHHRHHLHDIYIVAYIPVARQ
jgi:hypothetical protein